MLDNKKLLDSMKKFLLELPLDEEVLANYRDLPYQTKVGIFDRNCNGCGYACFQVDKTIYNNVQDAVNHAQLSGDRIIRYCSYPDENGEPSNHSLTEIVMNTCRFWKETNIEK